MDRVGRFQIIKELGWAYSVNLWYGTLAPNQITDTFLAKSLSLYTVGPYLNYSDNDTTELTLSILALIGGAIAAALGFPELEAGWGAPPCWDHPDRRNVWRWETLPNPPRRCEPF